MARQIATGIEQITQVLSKDQSDSLSDGWKDLRNKLNILLMSNNTMKTNETTAACQALDQLSHQARIEYIQANWGPLYAERCMPILLQLQNIERLMSK